MTCEIKKKLKAYHDFENRNIIAEFKIKKKLA